MTTVVAPLPAATLWLTRKGVLKAPPSTTATTRVPLRGTLEIATRMLCALQRLIVAANKYAAALDVSIGPEHIIRRAARTRRHQKE
jgi:hypothetical protein